MTAATPGVRGATVEFEHVLANVGRAVPSYTVMTMILPISLAISPQYGLAVIPTFLAMTLLAIPPILVNTYAALREVDRDLIEAARGMGMRERQVLRDVEIPIGLPIIIGGIRTAAVQVAATATLGQSSDTGTRSIPHRRHCPARIRLPVRGCDPGCGPCPPDRVRDRAGPTRADLSGVARERAPQPARNAGSGRRRRPPHRRTDMAPRAGARCRRGISGSPLV